MISELMALIIVFFLTPLVNRAAAGQEGFSHFGHTHYRQNRYHAAVTFVVDGKSWKIRNIELIDEKRVL